MKRIFIAIPLSAELKKHICDFSQEHEGFNVTWSIPENLHITLVPPLQVSDAQLGHLIEALTTMEAPAPFEIHFSEVSIGPNNHNPRLLWATGQTPTELAQLIDNINHSIQFKPDRTFTLHTTIATFSDLTVIEKVQHFNTPVRWIMLANEFAIMKSELLPIDAKYTTIRSFPLL